MSVQIQTRMVYIENCIKRIISAECVNAKENQRAVELAEALRIANNESLDEAHKYLINLCNEAESGKYAF